VRTTGEIRNVDPHDLIAPPRHNRIDPFVQRWVAGTNGNLYVSAINKLERYPIPRWPGPLPGSSGSRMLDIGCGWGRWMMAAANAGWTPYGIDIKAEAAAAATRVLRAHNRPGQAVAGDLTSLPFPDSHFDLVFSYSVLQHVSRQRVSKCLTEVLRVLKPGGQCVIEFPVYPGLTNWRHAKGSDENPDSWDVRYYDWRELHEVFGEFAGVRMKSDCILGIGVKFEDIDLLPWKYKPVALISEVFRLTTLLAPPLTRFSDSVFVLGRKS